jgi:hypothetical protein
MRRALGERAVLRPEAAFRDTLDEGIYDLRTNRQSRKWLRTGSASGGAMSSSNGGRCREARGRTRYSQPLPSPSPSKLCGSGGRTLKFVYGMSPQA